MDEDLDVLLTKKRDLEIRIGVLAELNARRINELTADTEERQRVFMELTDINSRIRVMRDTMPRERS